MTHKEYNGWYNYETWLVNLWLTNDEGTVEWLQEGLGVNSTVYEYAEGLKDAVTSEDFMPSLGECSLQADLLGAALSEVNWYELAEHYVADYAEGAD
jgi:hypothetical protein